ncbi:tripartite tricarboxylate transporter substrate binding protein [Ralstonia insidiosa]|jgi:tripartite-type tricarboxylate transporter receptor subunit TctC|uniref:Bug family tripartite tricarboxylate transporter substrate binding protein n=1 Tax=Ralstonia TaxID=48736 RepID=UPI00066482BC|nr:tripartite tricarboxylate transporter substrate binding protein [Ralstonia insidiosa]KMW44972.1 tat pathway signal sequence [Ralstonia sp. MD27]MBX3774046.1 tripartite tricarboxylate transporter substrate binding protein [Ralstonia pickettii]NPA02231.1 tripartite tricarboxylate transporter substrate binding protein [Betaproteobacteria bacterium]MBA9857881.1 tripartite tricarboxylate transporter substrate binding protein [Ralstonia insidiosa]MBA9871617.1 tripartite tricarboxylate transporter
MRACDSNLRADVPDTPDPRRRRAIAWLGALPVALALPARAELLGYPSHPLRLVVPAAEGSVFDAVARALATQLQQQIGRLADVDDRPAANGMAAGDLVARAPADGHTLLLQQTTFVVQPALEPAPYDPLRDFQPVAMVATLPLFLAVDARLPITTVTELIAQAHGESVSVNCGSDIIGTWSHLVAEQFVRDYAFHAPHVAVRGEAGLVQQVLAGRMAACFACYPSLSTGVSSGQLRLLGVTGSARSSFAPTTPTLRETGLAGFDYSAWVGAFMPARTPKPLLIRAATEFRRALASSDVIATLRAGGFEPEWSASDALAQAVRRDANHWQGLIRQVDLRVDTGE